MTVREFVPGEVERRLVCYIGNTSRTIAAFREAADWLEAHGPKHEEDERMERRVTLESDAVLEAEAHGNGVSLRVRTGDGRETTLLGDRDPKRAADDLRKIATFFDETAEAWPLEGVMTVEQFIQRASRIEASRWHEWKSLGGTLGKAARWCEQRGYLNEGGLLGLEGHKMLNNEADRAFEALREEER
jgi:hypothetical protein